MKFFAALRVLLIGCAAGRIAANSDMTPTAPQAGDASVFRAYLLEQGLAARWTGDATPLASEEIRAAYPGFRFYYTFKQPPPPPGAPLPEVIEAHERALEEYQKHSLRLTAGIDERGLIHAFRTPEDFNAGLRPIKSDEDARIAAAAILSLIGSEQVSPGVIPAREVGVTKNGAGWACLLAQKPRGIQGFVTFDLNGRCTSASKSLNYAPPVPP